MSKILAVANIKGGVGKTTTVVNLSAALAERGFRVLAIDLDPQASLTLSMGMKPEQVSVTIRQMLDPGSAALLPICESAEHWDFIPTNVDLRILEHELETHPHRIPQVAAGLSPLREKYDFILLDCPASAGPLIGAALAAADQVIIPLTPDYLAFQVSRSLFRIIKAIRQNVNPRLRVGGIFLTMYDTRTRHARDFMTTIHDTYDDVPFFSAVVRQSVKVKEAPSLGQSVLRYAPDSQAAKAYRVIAEEIVNGISSHTVDASVVTDEKERSLAPIVVESGSMRRKLPTLPIVLAAQAVTALAPMASPLRVMPAPKPASPLPTPNVPAFLTRTNVPVPPRRAEPTPSQHGGGYAHLIARANAAPQEKEYAFEAPALPRQEPPRTQTPTDPHTSFRELVPQSTADARGILLQAALESKFDQLLFVSTADDVPDLLTDAQLLVEHGFTVLAERMLERITELDATCADGWLGWARVTTDPLARVNFLQKALYLSPSRELRGELAIARLNLQEHAYLLLEEGTTGSDPERMARAHALFKHATTIDPSDERAWLGCARTADNLVEKLSYLEQARKLNPQSKQAQELYAILGSFVKDEPTERWGMEARKRMPLVLAAVFVALVTVFFALPLILPGR